jgi:hypothetical protein
MTPFFLFRPKPVLGKLWNLFVYLSDISTQNKLFVPSEMNVPTPRLLRHPEMICPLTKGLMWDPVVLAASGESYERCAIEKHLDDHGTDPETGRVLDHHERRLFPNVGLKAVIDDVFAILRTRIDPEP